MIYFHLLPKDKLEEAVSLPNQIFQNKYSRPAVCGFSGALDKQFGCPFLIPYTLRGVDINEKCKRCTCRRDNDTH